MSDVGTISCVKGRSLLGRSRPNTIKMASKGKVLQISMLNCLSKHFLHNSSFRCPKIPPLLIPTVSNPHCHNSPKSTSFLSFPFRSYSSEDEQNHANESKDWDRSKINPMEVDVDTSIAYMNSEAYRTTYHTNKVWELYRANHKYAYTPEPRKLCYRAGKLSTGNPCPICRDNYLLIHYKNIELLRQFMTPDGVWILKGRRTHICKAQERRLRVSILKAMDTGLLENKRLPPRKYDYTQYYPESAFADSRTINLPTTTDELDERSA